ncbi:alanine racemase [Actinospongicola halichondriae]|uniref:alanine racemase n=1 Tax=Actinospongicola halichondriae TaxID=3236844 RepID=UPI003D530FEA
MSASVATVDLAAIMANVRRLDSVADGASLCAVVKADGYGHGSVQVARAALDAGATWLGVAQVDEARVLRSEGIDAPILVLSELATDEIDAAVAMRLHLVVYRAALVDAISERAMAIGAPMVALHLKIDTGMRRVGCEPAEALDLARRIVGAPGVDLAGTMTHLACADEPDRTTTEQQLDRFDDAVGALEAAGIDPGIRHAANSAATIAHPRSRHDLVRVGIALYGIAPAPALAGAVDLVPALRWSTTVRHVKRVSAGESVSYGHRHTFEADTVVATIPVGYADGVRRRLGLVGGPVLIGGRRCPIVGVVTMDQLVVDCGPHADVAVGDEVVLIGGQGDEAITADEMAALLDTIGYEVVCDISARVERRHR